MPGGVSLKALARNERPASAVRTVQRLLGYLLPHKGMLASSLVWLVASSAATAATPALTGRVIDVAIAAARTGDSPRVLVVPALLLVSSTLVSWFAQRMQILVIGTVGQKALYALRAEVFDTIQRLPVAFYETTGSGDLMSRLINDIETIDRKSVV